MFKEFLGELIGTFILVFIGCSSVAISVTYGAYGLFECAIIWGLAVTFAIYASRSLSPAHINPAVTVAMAVAGKLPFSKIPAYVGAQMIGSFIAAILIFLIFDHTITTFEAANHIIRGEADSIKSAMIFGEFYPNPAFTLKVEVSMWGAFFTEVIGTMLLLLMIIILSDYNNPDNNFTPILIGLVVAVIIALIAPITQSCLNPARDLAPRLFTYFAGWGKAVFPGEGYEVLLVYIGGPLVGGVSGTFLSNIWKKYA